MPVRMGDEIRQRLDRLHKLGVFSGNRTPTTFTAPISIISWSCASRPVVSTSHGNESVGFTHGCPHRNDWRREGSSLRVRLPQAPSQEKLRLIARPSAKPAGGFAVNAARAARKSRMEDRTGRYPCTNPRSGWVGPETQRRTAFRAPRQYASVRCRSRRDNRARAITPTVCAKIKFRQ